jgi:hypothetical protein
MLLYSVGNNFKLSVNAGWGGGVVLSCMMSRMPNCLVHRIVTQSETGFYLNLQTFLCFSFRGFWIAGGFVLSSVLMHEGHVGWPVHELRRLSTIVVVFLFCGCYYFYCRRRSRFDTVARNLFFGDACIYIYI